MNSIIKVQLQKKEPSHLRKTPLIQILFRRTYILNRVLCKKILILSCTLVMENSFTENQNLKL